MMEAMIDGVMLVTPEGKILQANRSALRLCHYLEGKHLGTNPLVANPSPTLPTAVWQSCQTFLEGRDSLKHLDLLPADPLTLEDEIHSDWGSVRVRVRWLSAEVLSTPCLLITLEDQGQSAQYRAIAESQKYGLTPRETDVWQLKRAGYTYKAIAAKLIIAEDTVKKHIKNIHVKREMSQGVGSGE
jgi:DNA-binding CsgD family transcriptional regulator